MNETVLLREEEPPTPTREHSEDDEQPPGAGLIEFGHAEIFANQLLPTAVSAVSSSNTIEEMPRPRGRIVRTRRRTAVAPPPPTKAELFRRQFFPTVSPLQWDSWQWQLQNRLRTRSQLERVLELTEAERAGLTSRVGRLPFAITPYYAALLADTETGGPLRRTMVPTAAEFVLDPHDKIDPLGEHHDSPVPGLVHRYPDRALFLTTDSCAAYCRYCTRSRVVGKGEIGSDRARRWEAAIAYIAAHPEIRDVVLSGGDPLTMPTHRLQWLLSRLRGIAHVEIIRIGTKVPMVLPQRITPELVQMLRLYHPVWMSVHATHPAELTPEAQRAFGLLADAGIPLMSQTVLLREINDDAVTLKALYHGLLRARVKPYYLYQCDPVIGSAHFRTTVQTGLELIEQLQGHTSGLAVPTYVIDAPDGGGKIPMLLTRTVGRDGDDLLLRNYEGHTYRYPDPNAAGAVGATGGIGATDAAGVTGATCGACATGVTCGA